MFLLPVIRAIRGIRGSFGFLIVPSATTEPRSMDEIGEPQRHRDTKNGAESGVCGFVLQWARILASGDEAGIEVIMPHATDAKSAKARRDFFQILSWRP
jgi:hypothetical protein